MQTKTDSRPQADKADSERQATEVLEKAAEKTDLSGDPGKPMRAGLLFLALGLGGFLGWAAWAPLDEGVPAPGSIVIESQRKPVQHLSGGIVSKVMVSEAQKVKTGELLLQLDDSRQRAEYGTVKAQYYNVLARSARLQAERARRSQIEFPQALQQAAAEDPSARESMDLQRQFFASRQAALQSELRSIDENIASLQSQRAGLEARLSGRNAQLRLLEQQLTGSRDLARDGYLPRNRLLEEERMAADLAAQIADLQASIAANQSSIAELRFRRDARERDFYQRIDAELTEVSRDIPALAERLRALEAELQRTRITSPADGFVVGLQVQSVGAVIPPGSKIMDIVPENEKLVLDVQIQPQLVDRVHPGLRADIRFHAFQDRPQYVVEGQLISVSADRLTDPVSHQPYFLGRIEVLPETMKALEGKQLMPGMAAEAVIKTGERSLLDYLIRPLIRRVSTSMTEY